MLPMLPMLPTLVGLDPRQLDTDAGEKRARDETEAKTKYWRAVVTFGEWRLNQAVFSILGGYKLVPSPWSRDVALDWEEVQMGRPDPRRFTDDAKTVLVTVSEQIPAEPEVLGINPASGDWFKHGFKGTLSSTLLLESPSRPNEFFEMVAWHNRESTEKFNVAASEVNEKEKTTIQLKSYTEWPTAALGFLVDKFDNSIVSHVTRVVSGEGVHM